MIPSGFCVTMAVTWTFLSGTVGLSTREQALWEYYDRSGKGYGARSYIEHALTPLYAWELTEINKTEVKP